MCKIFYYDNMWLKISTRKKCFEIINIKRGSNRDLGIYSRGPKKSNVSLVSINLINSIF